MSDLERLQALSDAATPGPWYWDKIMGGIRVRDHYVVQAGNDDRSPEPPPDEALMLAAVNYVRSLLDEPA